MEAANAFASVYGVGYRGASFATERFLTVPKNGT